MKFFPFYKQLDATDCGPTCLKMIAKYYGKEFSSQNLTQKSFLTKEGVSILGLSRASEAIGLRSFIAKIAFNKMAEDAPLPCIVSWHKKHFLVVYQIRKKSVIVADPTFGILNLKLNEFLDGWTEGEDRSGTALFLETTPRFYETENDEKVSFSLFLSYLVPYKKYFIQILLGLFLGSLLQLVFPFLTQSVVDVGINTQDVGFINLVLIAQTMLIFSRTIVDFIRSWILLHVGTRINISIISDFLIKLMKLPISFFDTKMIGDLMQRIGDHRRIQSFISLATLNTIFSFVTLIIFSFVLAFYDPRILFIFFTGSILYVMWVMLFMKKRKEMDYKFFEKNALNQNALIQLITGIKDVKLANSEKRKRWEWEQLQAMLFKINIANLRVSQFQLIGSTFINETKNIILTIFSVKLVIDGEITLGMMLSIQYMIGQLNAPIGQLIGFLNSYQDAKISLERLGEIHNRPDEEEREAVRDVPKEKTIVFNELSFHYDSPTPQLVLNSINLTFRHGEITAIVGASGSGKTTLLKLLLKFYKATKGQILVGGVDINQINNYQWRNVSGSVLQDGYIFTDTVALNVALGEDSVDYEKLHYAADVANIREFIETLPQGYETKIGSNGHGLSQGQRQRILIARAVYKNPEVLLLDEATNALDANNESKIMSDLTTFFVGRTVIIAAHRLSTIKLAHQIIVLNKGNVEEIGTHEELLSNRGYYFELVRKQLLSA